MTMHIEGPWLSTTSTKKRQAKLTKAKQAELEVSWRERNVRLKEMGLPKETFEQHLEWVYGRGKKTNKKTKANEESSSSTGFQVYQTGKSCGSADNLSDNQASNAKSSTESILRRPAWITGPVATKQTPTYTGTKIIGIGTMHKSNAVPIFSDEEAKDISRMRRG